MAESTQPTRVADILRFIMDNVSITYPGPGQAVITIERPDTLNSLTVATLTELTAAGQEVSARGESLNVVLLRGRGRAFCSGLDLGLLDDNSGEGMFAAVREGAILMESLEAIPAVTVAVLGGAVVGGGVVLASACDLRIAARDTYFSMPEVDLGVPVRWGGVPRLVREMGSALAREIMMTCRPFTADEARAAGFLNQVVAADQLEDTVQELVKTLCAKPVQPLQAVKRRVIEAG
ncbi:MAG: enoyl-CoA hydratase/isomerase family protein [bacterium]|nr:enoyl-CoA hydratase/isomerase family protein [bacterium]MDE0644331.1 enoyl-CoA hydratase/isomerase family protein [bacterium]